MLFFIYVLGEEERGNNVARDEDKRRRNADRPAVIEEIPDTDDEDGFGGCEYIASTMPDGGYFIP